MRALLAAACLAAALPAAARADDRPPAPSVVVTGEGMISAAPDIGVVTSGVVTTAASAGAALKANAAAMSAVIAKLKEAKVEDRDVATSGLTVQPQYDYGSGSAPRAPKLMGYEVRNTVTVRARDLGRLGELIDGLVGAGSNQIEGLTFDVSDRSTKLDDARKQAIADARRKAELYAAGVGAKLGAPLAIDEMEVGGDEPIRPFVQRAKAMDAAPSTPIARGEQELRARVTIRWALER
jgi:uncharacterized protein YggE